MELTDREIEITKLISFGKSDKEIAYHLGISQHTVKAHKLNIYNKLGINKNTQLVHYAVTQGILSLDN